MKIPNYQDAKVLVVGDVMLDRYWQGQTDRISPESPVPVVNIQDCEEKPGGAGNVAVNIAALGARASLLAVIGEDEAGQSLEKTLQAQKIATHLLKTDDAPTITKLRVMSKHQQMIRLDFEKKLPNTLQAPLKNSFESILKQHQVLILSDYGKGTLQDVSEYIDQARQNQTAVLVDPKGRDFARYQGATLLTPNRKEFEIVMGVCATEEELHEKALLALERYQLEALLVTRSEEGMTLFQRHKEPVHLPAYTKEVFDVTGAGDTVIALIAATLASGCPLEQAIHVANVAASIVVTKLGAATVTASELHYELNRLQGLSAGVVDESALLSLVQEAKTQGERIVMTNGCFDILHVGHIHYLKKAKALGDRLVIAVNTDESVKQLKGPSRPINGLQERMTLLAELECVDWVIPFSESTPLRVIQEIKPDVLVKGGDYTVEGVVGGDHVIANGGEVKIIDYVNGFSTTKLIKTISEESA